MRREAGQRVEVLAYVAALDGAFHQRIDRPLDLSERVFVQLCGAADDRIQCRRNDVPRRDAINEQEHPGRKRFDRRHDLRELPLGCGQLLNLSQIDRLDQGIAARKVAIYPSGSHACFLLQSRRGWRRHRSV
jgi:hypothetical protein